MDLSSWLFGEIDRERLLDMDRRLRPVRRNALGALGAALVISAPWTGWWTLAPLAAAGLFALAGRRAPRGLHPEYAIFGAWVMAEALIAGSVALTGVTIGALAWLAIPVVTLPARFSARVVAVGVMIALGLVVAVGLGTEAQAIVHNPPLILVPTSLILATTMLSVALMRSDIEHRDECVIDQLTGLLNRKALAFADLAPDVPGIELYGPPVDRRAGIVSFNVEGVHPHDVGQVLGLDAVAIRGGHHCCQPLMQRLGVVATNRASFYLYTVPEEIDRLHASLLRVQKVFAG